MKRFWWIGWLLSSAAWGQDTTGAVKPLRVTGYVKELIWVRFDKGFREAAATNLVHHRLNIAWNPASRWSGRLDIRNRLFVGDEVRGGVTFRQQLRNEEEKSNLSVTWFQRRSALLHTNVERLWMAYRYRKGVVRAGRQRINWGMHTFWNPNDLFNHYNLLDFDYEERPGSEAIRVEHNLPNGQLIDVALARTRSGQILAARLSGNLRGYDWQLLSGIRGKRVTIGGGWAGSIGGAGFKGEVQAYGNPFNWLLSLESDYLFGSGWYGSASLLYNQNGLHRPVVDLRLLTIRTSSETPMPTRWNLLVHGSRQITPLLSFTTSILFAPGTNWLILFPGVRYNLETNWDIDFVWQSFFAETAKFGALGHTGFLRVRWSY